MNNAIAGLLMIAGGLALAVGGVFVLMRKPPDLMMASLAKSQNARSVVPDPASSAPTKTSVEKGEAFEQWIVKRFSPEYFTIKE